MSKPLIFGNIVINPKHLGSVYCTNDECKIYMRDKQDVHYRCTKNDHPKCYNEIQKLFFK